MDETKQNFKEWIDGAISLVRPWKLALIFTNLFWAIVFMAFLFLAYMAPDTSYQYQDLESSVQTQADGQYDPSMAPDRN